VDSTEKPHVLTDLSFFSKMPREAVIKRCEEEIVRAKERLASTEFQWIMAASNCADRAAAAIAYARYRSAANFLRNRKWMLDKLNAYPVTEADNGAV